MPVTPKSAENIPIDHEDKSPYLAFKHLELGSPEYQAAFDLRKKILRDPIGLHFSESEIRREHEYFHLGAFLSQRLVACLLLVKISQRVVKMRQVAVESALQGQGIGKKLVIFSEDFARTHGFSLMELNARDTAIPFYLKSGYKSVGDIFVEIAIPHQKMEKNLGGT